MSRSNKRRKSALKANHLRNTKDDSDASDNESTSSDDLTPPPVPPEFKRTSLRSQIAEKDTKIAELEANVSALQAELISLQHANDHLRLDYSSLIQEKQTISRMNTALRTLKRKADTTHIEELRGKQKRIKRLETERTNKQQENLSIISSLQCSLNDTASHVSRLQLDLASSTAQIQARDSTKSISHCGGEYTEVARELARKLSFAGCAADKIELAVKACAEAFGIQIRRRFMSARTVGRVIDEGGKYGELQLAREILEAPAREQRKMDKNEYFRKKLGEMKDHAADGKKGFRLSADHKKDIIIRDMGRLEMDDADTQTSQILLTMLSITDEELADAGNEGSLFDLPD
ncbi:hypothetical protein B0H11DRAFT_2429951 [Mycena galericulata]|nr:hypothetical protein B0H11DRAFT_2429951 [Mycena galericulata]